MMTAKQIQFVKPSAKRIEIPVGPPGLFLIVQVSGVKSWALRYRWQSKPKKLTLGGYPTLSLHAARSEAHSALAALRNGRDPAAEMEKDREPTSAELVAEEWLRRDVAGTRTAKEAERILRKHILPECKGKLVTEIARADINRVTDAIVDAGHGVAANRALSIAKRWMNWCVSRGYVQHSPIANLRAPATETSRDRVLTDEELRDVWTVASELGYPNGDFMRLLVLTGQRRSEVSGMRWQDVDLEHELWTLPAELTKAGRQHDVPLSAEALAILRNVPKHAGPYVFTTGDGSVAINGFPKLKKRLDAAIVRLRKEAGDEVPFAAWTMHDLRRSCASWMAKNGVAPQVLARILNHAPGSTMGVTKIYNRYAYGPEKRSALGQWGKHVAALAAQKAKQRRAS